MKKYFVHKTACFAAILAMASILSSCSFFQRNEYEAVHLYDVGLSSMVSRYAVEVRPFASDTAARYKMLFRTSDSELKTDEYNRWTLPPAQMITKYLRSAFAVDRAPGEDCDGSRFIINGNILAFEADLKTSKARLYVSYDISMPENAGFKPYVSSLNLEIPLESHTASAFAEAMSIASERLAEVLLEDMNALAEKYCKKSK